MSTPTPVVEQLFHRVYSRGVTLRISTTAIPAYDPDTGLPVDDAAVETWLNAFVRVAGVTSIDLPTMGRDVIELNELETGPAALGGGETIEMFFQKNRAPGDKNIDPLAAMLNMSQVQLQILYDRFIRDTIFGFSVDFPSGAFLLGLGFVNSLEPSIENSKIIEISTELQSSFGMQYISVCDTLDDLTGIWMNYLKSIQCPS